jgi:hypothetical protein
MLNIHEFFCNDVFDALLVHLRQCETCRHGVRRLFDELPVLSMFMPSDAKKAVLAALEAMDKEKL